MSNPTIPKIPGIHGKLAVLERRLDHLNRRLDKDDYTSSASAEFDRSEVAALAAAIESMTYVSAIA